MPDSVANQRTVIQRYINARDYVSMYNYIARQVISLPQGGRLTQWLVSAAYINSPGSSTQNVLKHIVWATNSRSRVFFGGNPVTDIENQQVSNALAQDVGAYYLNYLSGNGLFNPQGLFQRDVNTAVEYLGLPDHGWAGGLLGAATRGHGCGWKTANAN